MTKPYLFLDVDGVLNADHPTFGDTKEVDVKVNSRTFTITYSPCLLTRLEALPVEIVWVTTWEEHAETCLVPGIGALHGKRHLSSAGHRKFSDFYGLWKQSTIEAELERDPRPFIWIDDDAIGRDAETDLKAAGVPFHLVRANYDTGITEKDLAGIEEFLAGL